MGEVDARLLRPGDDRGGRGGAGDLAGDAVVDAGAQFRRRIDRGGVDDRRAAHVGDAVVADRAPDRRALHLAQADVGAGALGQGPGKAPAVAVEHRQGPEIHRMVRHVPADDVAERVQIGAAIVIHDTFRIAGGAGGVVQRDRVPFVGRILPRIGGIAGVQERLVGHLPQQRAAGGLGVVDVDHQRLLVQQRQRPLDRRRELAVGDQNAGAAMAQHEGDRLGIEPGVERVQHRAQHGNAEMRLVDRRHVGRHHRNGIAAADPAPRQRRSQPTATVIGLPPAVTHRAMHHGKTIRIHRRGTLQERHRVERRVVRRSAVETGQIGGVGHGRAPFAREIRAGEGGRSKQGQGALPPGPPARGQVPWTPRWVPCRWGVARRARGGVGGRGTGRNRALFPRRPARPGPPRHPHRHGTK